MDLWIPGAGAAAVFASLLLLFVVQRRVAHAPRPLRLRALWLAGALPPLALLSAAAGILLYLYLEMLGVHADRRSESFSSAHLGGGYELHVYGVPANADVMRPSGDTLSVGVRRLGFDERWILIDFGDDRHTLVDRDSDAIVERLSSSDVAARFAALGRPPPELRAPQAVVDALPRFTPQILGWSVGVLPPALLCIWLVLTLRGARAQARRGPHDAIPA